MQKIISTSSKKSSCEYNNWGKERREKGKEKREKRKGRREKRKGKREKTKEEIFS